MRACYTAAKRRKGRSTMRTRAARLVAEALFQDEHGQSPAAEELDWLERDLADFVEQAGAWTWFLLSACMLVVIVLVPVFAKSPRTLGGLSIDARRKALHRMEESDLSLPFLAVKAALCLVHYEHPAAAARVGFDGRCLSGRARQ